MVIVGGGVIGRCVAWRLALAGSRVVLFDALNPVRGSWGETRASHLAMEDRTLLRMGLASTSEWVALEEAYGAAAAAESVDDAAERRFYFRAGRLFAGPIGSVGPVVSARVTSVAPSLPGAAKQKPQTSSHAVSKTHEREGGADATT